jgi:hypothetical protein
MCGFRSLGADVRLVKTALDYVMYEFGRVGISAWVTGVIVSDGHHPLLHMAGYPQWVQSSVMLM